MFARSTTLLASLLLGACRGAASPADHPERWAELRTPHFLMKTDLDASAAAPLLEELEQTYAVLQDLAFPTEVRLEGVTEVVVFRDAETYKLFAPAGSAGIYRRQSDWDEYPQLVLFQELTGDTRRTLRHELTHRFASFYYPSAPTWFTEGLAVYYETIVVDENQVRLGASPPARNFILGTPLRIAANPGSGLVPERPNRVRLPSAGEVRAMTPTDFYVAMLGEGEPSYDDLLQTSANYEAAWALVHVLKHESDRLRQGFRAYTQALYTASKSSREAWDLAFGAISADVDRQVDAFTKEPNHTVIVLPIQLRKLDRPQSRTMSEGEVRVMLASLPKTRADGFDEEGRALDEALVRAPNEPGLYIARARHWSAAGYWTRAVDDLRRARQIAGTGTRPLSLLARIAIEEEVKKAPDLRRWVSVEPLLQDLEKEAKAADDIALCAHYESLRGHPDRALDFARQAIKADTSRARGYEAAATALAEREHLEQAIELQRTVLHLSGESPHFISALKRLRYFEKALKEKKAEEGSR